MIFFDRGNPPLSTVSNPSLRRGLPWMLIGIRFFFSFSQVGPFTPVTSPTMHTPQNRCYPDEKEASQKFALDMGSSVINPRLCLDRHFSGRWPSAKVLFDISQWASLGTVHGHLVSCGCWLAWSFSFLVFAFTHESSVLRLTASMTTFTL